MEIAQTQTHKKFDEEKAITILYSFNKIYSLIIFVEVSSFVILCTNQIYVETFILVPSNVPILTNAFSVAKSSQISFEFWGTFFSLLVLLRAKTEPNDSGTYWFNAINKIMQCANLLLTYKFIKNYKNMSQESCCFCSDIERKM